MEKVSIKYTGAVEKIGYKGRKLIPGVIYDIDFDEWPLYVNNPHFKLVKPLPHNAKMNVPKVRKPRKSFVKKEVKDVLEEKEVE